MAEAKFYTYIHRKADTGEIFYVGKGTGNRAWSDRGRNRHWHSVVNKHGFDVVIVCKNMEEQAAFDLEIALIAIYGRKDTGAGKLANSTDGGEGQAGRIMSEDARRAMSLRQTGDFNVSKREDVRAKISAAMSGPSNPMKIPHVQKKVSQAKKGLKLSTETRQKMSDAHKGIVFSAQACKNISIARMGGTDPVLSKIYRDERRRKISEAMKLSHANRRLQREQIASL